MAEGSKQGSYWDDYKKYYSALIDAEMSRADASGDGKAWDSLEEMKKQIQRIHTMGTLRDRVFNPYEVKTAMNRLGSWGGGGGQ